MQLYGQFTDLELAGLLSEGDKEAFREIYIRYWNKLYVIARNRLKNSAEAEEVVQDIFCNLWRKRQSFTLIKGFSNYFAVAVKFTVIDLLAKKARQINYEREAWYSFSENDNSTIQTIELNELEKQLQESILLLPEKCRIVFKLRYEKGYSQNQISLELNISEKTVEAHLAKARKTLRGALGSGLVLLISLL
ncbi:RNA polymerase sigma factor [Desertivirga brevis]|uniref:RNA polymerase sigma factor n=1 Tax=Desertivirga brevis TaxID=2810310 RepID=UPI001A9578AD|nr:RNA polymerase sigma-70 factor [Pedobacter sp. SYSU D00873]